jgi:iron complex transport system substrate-binding protein
MWFRPFAVALVALLLGTSSAIAKTPRVVALTPFTANVTVALGVTPAAVGDPGSGGAALAGAARTAARLRLSHPNGPNLEQLAAMRPDVLLSSLIWRPGSAAIRRLGIRVYDDIEPTRLDGAAASVQQIAAILGRRSQGAGLAARLSAQIAAERRAARAHPRVLVVLGLARSTMALLADSWASDIVRAAGGRLVTDGIRPVGTTGEGAVVGNLSNEKVVALNPDVILVVPHGASSDVSRIAGYYRDYRPWRSTRAGRNGRIYVTDNDRLLQAYSDPAAQIRFVRGTYLNR